MWTFFLTSITPNICRRYEWVNRAFNKKIHRKIWIKNSQPIRLTHFLIYIDTQQFQLLCLPALLLMILWMLFCCCSCWCSVFFFCRNVIYKLLIQCLSLFFIAECDGDFGHCERWEFISFFMCRLVREFYGARWQSQLFFYDSST